MNKAFVAGTIVVAGIALLTGVLTSGSPALSSPGTITITTRAVKLQFINRGGRGRGSGDVELKRFLLYNKGIRERAIGYGDLVCTYTARYARQCSGTYSLPKGRIVVGGVITYTQFHEMAVIGGTGIYDNVRGTLTVTLLSRNPERAIAVFRLGV